MQAVLGQEDSLPKSSLGIMYNSILMHRFFSENISAAFSVLVYNGATEALRG